MALMARYPDKHFDLAIVDPPYGINMSNPKFRSVSNRPNSKINAGKSQFKKNNWDSECPDIKYFKELLRVSENQIIWGANYFCEFIPNGKGWIFWDKQMGDNSFSAGEFAYQSITIKSHSVSIPSMRVNNTRIHPTEKPVKLYKWLLSKFCKCLECNSTGEVPSNIIDCDIQTCKKCKGDVPKILDTHLGSGSIAIACHDYGFDLTACELDKDYYEAAMKRIDNHVRNATKLSFDKPKENITQSGIVF